MRLHSFSSFIILVGISSLTSGAFAASRPYNTEMLGSFSLVASGTNNTIACPKNLTVSESPATSPDQKAPWGLDFMGSQHDELGYIPYYDQVGPQVTEDAQYATKTTQKTAFRGNSIVSDNGGFSMGVYGNENTTVDFDPAAKTLTYKDHTQLILVWQTEQTLCRYKKN
jgi:hypothetical protein